MSRRTCRLSSLFALSIFGSTLCQAQIIKPDLGEAGRACGPKISKDSVMVLDLEPFGQRHGDAYQFAEKHAGDFDLVNTEPEEIRKKIRFARHWYSKDSGIKHAQSEAAKRGCDLVLVLSSGFHKDKLIYTDTEDRVQTGYKYIGYAVVLMGTQGGS